MKKQKILMVCLGNICRSPMADGLLRRKAIENNLPIIVDSAGTSATHVGEAPDSRMQKTAEKHNTPINNLRSRQFVAEDFDLFESIYVMDESNYKNVISLARTETDKNKVDFILNLIEPNKNLEVPDPYFGGEQGFEHVFKLLDKATDKIIHLLKNKNND